MTAYTVFLTPEAQQDILRLDALSRRVFWTNWSGWESMPN